jgi:type II secretory pathway component PulF
MKKVKLVVWILIVVFVVVVIYQNKDFFWETKKSMTINLPLIPEQYKTLPEVELLIIFGIFFAAGLLLGIYFLISRGLKKKKLVKTLKAQVKEQTEKADTLEEELRALRGDPVLPDTSGNTDTVAQAAGSSPGGQLPAGDTRQ